MIRHATEADIPEIVRLGRMFWSETSYGAIPYCEESMTATAHGILHNGLLFVAEKGGNIIGGAGAVIAPMYFNHAVSMAAELFWWLEPAYRNNGAGIYLLRALEGAAKEKGLKIMSMMCLESIEPEKVSALYVRCGYQPAERTFVKFL